MLATLSVAVLTPATLPLAAPTTLVVPDGMVVCTTAEPVTAAEVGVAALAVTDDWARLDGARRRRERRSERVDMLGKVGRRVEVSRKKGWGTATRRVG